MTRTVYATLHDREWLHLEEPMDLPADGSVRLKVTIESGEEQEAPRATSFLDVVQGLRLDGPPDLSTRFHDYLYGDGDSGR
jgi:hypothetical protein